MEIPCFLFVHQSISHGRFFFSQNNNIQHQGAVSYASFSQGAPVPTKTPQQLVPVPEPQPTQYQSPQTLNQLRHIQYQTTPPQYQQQYVPDEEQLIYNFQQPRLDAYHTVFPAPPTIQISQPIFREQIPQPQNPQQVQYLQKPYQNALSQYQNQQPQYRPLNQNVQIEPPPQPRVPVNNLVQAGGIEKPIYFKPGSLQASVYPPVQYFGKFAQSIFGDRLNQ